MYSVQQLLWYKKRRQLFIRTHGRLNFWRADAGCFDTRVPPHCTATRNSSTGETIIRGKGINIIHPVSAAHLHDVCRWWIAFDTFNPGWAVVGGSDVVAVATPYTINSFNREMNRDCGAQGNQQGKYDASNTGEKSNKGRAKKKKPKKQKIKDIKATLVIRKT